MRVVLFYSEVDSFNFDADRLEDELQKRGHEVFILDLLAPPADDPHSYEHFFKFLSYKVDLVICFDGLGIREDLFIELWDSHQAAVVDILMDPPLRFHPTLEKHPRDYFLFCCDQEHVRYVKEYFGQTVPYVAFMPHAGTPPEKGAPNIPYEDKKYDILFTGAYFPYEDSFVGLQKMFPKDSDMYRLYQAVFQKLVDDTHLTVERALSHTLEQLGWPVSNEARKTMLRCAEPIDWAIRMYHREKVVTALAGSGMGLHLLGDGWERHPSIKRANVHHISGRIPYERTFSFMAEARIDLNVMPWFKAGTHDRIFNTLLRHSVPLTDPSSWIMENFTDGEDIALYDLDHLEQLPDIVQGLLEDPERAARIIRNGSEKVRQSFTWSACVDQIMDAVGHKV